MKSTYRTRQQDDLLTYLAQNPGVHLTAAQIKSEFALRNKNIGTATIYRQLDRLVEDGTVRRYLLDTGDGACYEYVGDPRGCAAHFHLKCEKCGRLIHMSCDEMSQLQSHLLAEHGFAWNIGKTVFYGVCEECRKNAPPDETKP